jgi:dolichol-phosphate mannosyltransferase
VPTAKQLRATLVLPTYNERENLPQLVAAIDELPVRLHIIIVDDNSPDGTGQMADELAARGPDIEVIHRTQKMGLGSAYAWGFRQAIGEDADVILTMDADFSHHPQYLPKLIEASRHYDLVIGSRYVPCGGVRDWDWQRKALSWGANTLSHMVLGLQARDCTAGFRCYRRSVLEAIRPDTIRASGYSYLIEMLYRCQRYGFSVGEVPIVFTDRRLGQSKISSDEIIKAGLTVARLASQRLTNGRHRIRTTPASRPYGCS